MEISSIYAVATLVGAPGEGGLVSIADRAQEAFAEAYLAMGKQRRSLWEAGNDPLVASNPEALARLQVAQAQHQHVVGLTAALTHHVVEGIETLLKS